MLNTILRSSLFQSAGIYTAAHLLTASVPFLLLPILTRYLTPADYGIVAMFQVILGIVSALIGLSIHGAIGRQYFEKDTIDFPK
jgi:O-antigen/teichoic acid export membrane protein